MNIMSGEKISKIRISMILRSVTKHVENQNWFAVFLDLVIVVFGVFIGIQVSNWNQNLENQQIANRYLERLTDDLQYEKESYQNTASYFKTVLSYANSALKAYHQPTNQLSVDFLIDHYQATQTQEAPARRGTFNELIATGRIELISNEKIRIAISNFYENSSARYMTMNKNTYLPYRTLIRMQMDETVQIKIRENCGDIFKVRGDGVFYLQLPNTCKINIPSSLVKQEIEKIFASNNIRQNLRLKQSALEIMIRSLNNGIHSTELALKALKEAN